MFEFERKYYKVIKILPTVYVKEFKHQLIILSKKFYFYFVNYMLDIN